MRRKKDREVARHKDKVETAMESAAEFDAEVEKLRELFRSAEFQHRIEVGEINQALESFKEKEKMWKEFVDIRENELKELRRGLGEESEETREVRAKKRHRRKLKGKRKAEKSKDCKKCGVAHKSCDEALGAHRKKGAKHANANK